VAIASQNNRLGDDYGITRFPTIVLLTSEGKELMRTGYQRGGAAAWIAAVEQEIEQEVRRGSGSP
jgi:protein-disulfide isomerase-like protein with CxxC motif